VINVFFIYPAMSQKMTEEFSEAPPVMFMIMGAAIGLFGSLIFPVVLLIFLNVGTVKDQFVGAAGQSDSAF
jgi:hypothetical protein